MALVGWPVYIAASHALRWAAMSIEHSVSVKEAAARLQVHPSTLRKNIRAGKVRGVIRRYGAAVEIDARALAAMMRARARGAEDQLHD